MLQGGAVAGFIDEVGFINIEHAKFVQLGFNEQVEFFNLAVHYRGNGHVETFFDHIHFADAFAIAEAFGDAVDVAADEYIAFLFERLNGEVV